MSERRIWSAAQRWSSSKTTSGAGFFALESTGCQCNRSIIMRSPESCHPAKIHPNERAYYLGTHSSPRDAVGCDAVDYDALSGHG